MGQKDEKRSQTQGVSINGDRRTRSVTVGFHSSEGHVDCYTIDVMHAFKMIQILVDQCAWVVDRDAEQPQKSYRKFDA